MSQIIIVSNRLPISVTKKNAKLVYSPSLGGLATGLSSYVNDPGNTWIGWPGIASDDLNEHEKQSIATELEKRNCYPVFLTKKQIDEFYNGYSNSILWPLFHNLPGRKIEPDQLNTWWQAYKNVNKHFAEVVVNLARANSQIWIHDYQLLLLPELLRKDKAGTNIGFFLHIPFPNTKTFSRLAESKKLLKGIVGADLIGFHTTGYAKNFLSFSKAAGVGKINDSVISLPSHRAEVNVFPMGIDYDKYAKAARSKQVKLAAKRYQKKYSGLKLIVSIDRLDPTKGLVERLNAYREFLKRNPKQRGKVVFAMVAAPSRTDIAVYKNLAKRLELLSKKINADFGNAKWQPVDYMNIAQPFEEVAALFQIADIAFIVPIRDGMNLAAKEFVASNKKMGVLILSETAGAAEELQDALLVNPKQPESLVQALEQAAAMPPKELRTRLRRMKKDLSVHTVQYWAKTFVDTLQQPIPHTPRLTRALNPRLLRKLYTDYLQTKRHLLLLDYDGTLVPFSSHYENAGPPKAIYKLLADLSTNKTNDVVLISGRNAKDLQTWFGDLPINLVAEHGADIKKAGNKNWRTSDKTSTSWKRLLQPSLEKYARLAPGAHVEVKSNSLVWHYRSAKPYNAQKYAVIIRKALKPVLKKYRLELLQGNKVLEIKNPKVSKANAAQPWLNRNYPFVLSMGDDLTDESLFLALPPDSYAIKVGRGRTAARLRVRSSKDAVSLLRKLAKS